MRKHRIISMGLALVLVCSSLSPMGVMAKEPVQSEMEVVGAATPEELGFSVRDAGDGTLEIEQVFDKECTEIVIPAEVDGKKITRIGNDAFQGCGKLTSVTMPEAGITYIGTSAFSGCESLTEITIPQGITAIEEGAFSGCSSLTNLVIPEGVTQLKASAFSGCVGLTNIQLPESLKIIEKFVFSDCTGLTAIHFPAGLEEIGSSAFQECSNLASLELPAGLKKLEGGVFEHCTSLQGEVTIPKSVEEISSNPFVYCDKLKAVVVDPDNPNFCSQDGALYNKDITQLICCPGAKQGSYTIPETVAKADMHAFYGCQSLTELNIPAAMEKIPGDPFSNCISLIDFKVDANNSSYKSIEGVLYDKPGNSMQACPGGRSELVIPEGVRRVSIVAFWGCGKMKKITFPASVENIEGDFGDWYQDQEGFSFVVVRDSYTENYAIEYNIPYTYVDDPENPDDPEEPDDPEDPDDPEEPDKPEQTKGEYRYRELEDGTLEITGYIGKETKLTLPAELDGKKVTAIGDGALEGLSDIKELEIPQGVTSIGVDAFSGCVSLSKINLPKGIDSIGAGAFFTCFQLSEIQIPEGVTEIEFQTFSGCINLKKVVLPKGIAWIGEEAFSGCSALTEINLPEGLTEIEEMAFYGCSSLTGMKMPETVETMGRYVFVDCKNLKEVVLPAGIVELGYGMFKGCSADLTLLVDRKSQAENYAKKEGLTYRYRTACKHNYKSTIVKATLKKDGSITKTCTICGEKEPATIIYAPKTITLSKNKFTYNGKAQTVAVTVKDSKNKVLKKGTDYTISYADDRKSVGTHTATIKFKGNYQGSLDKTYTIQPKGTTVSTLTGKSKSIQIKWKKQASQTSGYQIQYSTSSKFTKKTTGTVSIKKNTTVSKTVSKLNAAKKYYVRIRTYKEVKVNNKSKNIYSGWSKAKSVTTLK